MEIRKKLNELSRKLDGLKIRTDPIYRVTYNYDATQLRGSCAGVVFPATRDELADTIRVASELSIPIYVRGAGSGFSGGAVPVESGLVVSTEKLSRIIEFDPDRMVVKVEAGVINGDLQRYLERKGFFYPPDPASLDFSTIGGNIAENSGGPRAFKYGVTRRYVRSLEWVTARGEIVESDVHGISSILIGSEGTLGVIYSAELSVLPFPERRKTALLVTGGDVEAIRFSGKVISSGFVPSVLEYIDSRTILCVSEYLELDGFEPGNGYLFVEFDGTAEEVEEQFQAFRKLCIRNDIRIHEARDDVERDLLWELRRSISPSLARRGVTKVNEDISLPLGTLVEGIEFIGELARELKLDCYVFGHCGDGNLHVNIMTDRRRKEEMKRVERFVEELFMKVVSLGGSLSGEHGIGMTKKGYLRLLMSPEQMDFERLIGNAMDPHGVLNPGKYFR